MGNKKTKQPKTDPAAKPDAQVADKPTAENKKNNLKNVTLKIFIIGKNRFIKITIFSLHFFILYLLILLFLINYFLR